MRVVPFGRKCFVRFKILSDPKEYQQFQKGFLEEFFRLTQKVGTPIPEEYLKRSKVVGVMGRDGTMIAGYIINTTLPFRLLDFVPPDHRNEVSPPFEQTWNDCVEVTCVWKIPNRVSPLLMSARFWPRVQLEILATSKQLMIGHTQNEKLNQFYTWASPVTLYQGPSSFGLNSHLFAYRRAQIVLCFVLLYVVETPKRLMKRFKA